MLKPNWEGISVHLAQSDQISFVFTTIIGDQPWFCHQGNIQYSVYSEQLTINVLYHKNISMIVSNLSKTYV